jgi:RNA polymerase sigma factor (sigma-70 family)
MAMRSLKAGVGDIQTLFRGGSVVGFSDAQLLERYLSGTGDDAEVAFAGVVDRHGAMVLRVCNDVLDNPHDAQDAAQVTFLMLAKRAGTIRRRNALGSWLFGVARRVAARARVEAARRRALERRRAEMAMREHDRRSRAPVTGERWQELFEEINRLSEHHRSAIVLCDLEGLNHEQAAQRLGCPLKTVQGRLYAARELLRHRLTRRGVTVSAALLGASLAGRTAEAAQSAAWVERTARAATQLAAGQGVEGFLSAESAELFRSVSRAMTMTKLKISALAGIALAASTVGMAVGLGGTSDPAVVEPPPPQLVPTVVATPAPADPAPPNPVALRMQRNNLKQVGLALHSYREVHGSFPAAAIQGPDGRPLLSWRVAILPYLLADNLYQSFKLDEPWDSPHNKPLLDRMPQVFAPLRGQGQAAGSLTQFRVFAGRGTPFEGGRAPRWDDFTDGPGQTILVVEADEAVPWTKPDELPYAADKPLPALGGGPQKSFLVMMADARVLTIASDFDAALLRRAITTNDKQPVDVERLESHEPRPGPSGNEPGQDGGRGAGQTSTARSGDRILVGGRVLDPDGKPLAGAAVSFIRPGPFDWVPHSRAPRRPESSATSGADGRFQLQVDRAHWEDTHERVRTFPHPGHPARPTIPLLAARAAGYGPGWVYLAKPEAGADVTLRLAKDDIPIEGRIFDLEGRPVPGATVSTDEILATPDEDLTPVIRSEGRGNVPAKYLGASVANLPGTLTTDGAGQFRLTGIGRERVVSLRISGPTIQTGDIHVMTRIDKGFEVRYERPKLPVANSPSMDARNKVYGARFELAVGPTKPIEGVVRDRATGRPLPGAVIVGVFVYVRDGSLQGVSGFSADSAKADAQGRFRLVGAPKSSDLGIHVFSPEDQPYLETIERVGDTPGFAPIVHDVSLTRGIRVRGRLTDRASGLPVRGFVHYFLLSSNPRWDELRDFRVTNSRVPTGDDGSFSIVALDGPGLLAACAYSERFTRGVGVDRIKLAKQISNSYIAAPVNAHPQLYDTLVELDLAADSRGEERTIELIPVK